MKLLRLVLLSAVSASGILFAASGSAQSNLLVRHWSGVVPSPTQTAETVAQLAQAGQKTKIRFGAAVAYDSAGAFADSVAVADLNGDGKIDLVVLDYCQKVEQGICQTTGAVSVLLGNGDGTFQPAVTYSTGAYWANSVAVWDLNGDGIPDLVVANYCLSFGQYTCAGIGAVSVLLGHGDGTFQPAVNYSSGADGAYSVAIRDLNGDGKPDLVVANLDTGSWTGSVGVLLGNGDGTFQSAVNYSSGGYEADSVAIGDFNGDGIPDLAVASYCEERYACEPGYIDGKVGVLLGNGDGTFQPVVTYNSGGWYADTVAAADLRGGGVVDLVVANEFDGKGDSKRDAVVVLLGNGDGTFQPAVTYLAGGSLIDSAVIADVNGDGIPDLVVVGECHNIYIGIGCGGTGTVSVLLGNGDGTFQAPVTYLSGGYEGSSIAIGDVNGDGRPDLVVTNACGSSGSGCIGPNGSVAVLLNKTSYATKTALTSSPNPAHINQNVTFTATIASTPPVPNGEVVAFYNGKTNLGTGKTTNGVAGLTTLFSKAKTYTIKASYLGDAFHKASSGMVKQVVNP